MTSLLRRDWILGVQSTGGKRKQNVHRRWQRRSLRRWTWSRQNASRIGPKAFLLW